MRLTKPRSRFSESAFLNGHGFAGTVKRFSESCFCHRISRLP
jgi:hypothetical protein